MENYDSGAYQPPTIQHNNRNKKFVILACILATIIAATIVLSAFAKQAGTSPLTINVSDNSATVSIAQTGHETREVGKGSATIRLAPGDYTVAARTDQSEVIRAVTVTKGQQNSITLDLKAMQSPKPLAEYTAQDIYVKGSALYFVNLPFQILNSYTPGNYKVDTYAPDVYPVTRAFWINERQLYAETASKYWLYVSDGKPSLLVPGNKLLDPDTSISFNRGGAYAYVDSSQNVVTGDNPSSKPITVVQKSGNNARVSLAGNGNILLYSPERTYAADVKPSQVYIKSTNQLRTLPTQLQGIDHVVWSPNGSSFAYATKSGIFISDASGQNIEPISATSPSRPNSLTWASDDRLLFVENDAVWLYRQDEKSSGKIAPITDTFSDNQSFFVNAAGDMAYYGTVPKNGQGGNIYSISLK